MNRAFNPRALYSVRRGLYDIWTSLFRQRQSIRSVIERAGVLRPNLRVLDAGCGSGAATMALVDALRARSLRYGCIDAFDTTPAMLDRFREILVDEQVKRTALVEANVLALDRQLPESWTNYGLILCTSMLEYLPPAELPHALFLLRKRLAADGTLVAIITRRNIVSRIVIEWAWKARAYSAGELRAAFHDAGFQMRFATFPLSYGWMNITNYVILAQPEPDASEPAV